jgi:hypothetical protein
MIRFIKINALVFAMATAFSCDKLDELTEFNITQDFSSVVYVDVIEDSEGAVQIWSQSATLDIASNDQIQENLDLIQDVKISSITFKIINFTGVEGAVATEASLSFEDTVISVSDIQLEDSTTIYTIGSDSELSAIANDLKNDVEITTTASGKVSSTPVKFDVYISLDVTTTIDVL